MYDPVVNIVKKGHESLERALFSEIQAGDTFFCRQLPIVAGGDAHISGDSSYNGYLVYDNTCDQNGWFPEDLDGKKGEVSMAGTQQNKE